MINYWKWVHYIVGFWILAATIKFTYSVDTLIYITNSISVPFGPGPLLSFVGNSIRAVLGLLVIFDGYKMEKTDDA